MCVFLAFSQNSTKQTKKDTKRTEQRTKYALCNTAQYGAVHLSLTQKMSTKTSAKHVQKIAKHPQNTAKHFFF